MQQMMPELYERFIPKRCKQTVHMPFNLLITYHYTLFNVD